MSRIQMASLMKISLLLSSIASINACTKDFADAIQITAPLHASQNFSCFPEEEEGLTKYKWEKLTNCTKEGSFLLHFLPNAENQSNNSNILELKDVTLQDNAIYRCSAKKNDTIITDNPINFTVIEMPKIEQFDAKSVMVGKILVRWKVKPGSHNITKYRVLCKVNGTEKRIVLDEIANGGVSSTLLDAGELENGAVCVIGIELVNLLNHTSEFWSPDGVKTVQEDSVPVPVIVETTSDSVRIQWKPPSADLQDYYDYEVIQTRAEKVIRSPYSNVTTNHIIVSEFEKDMGYQFKVRTCIRNTSVCGNWSEEARFDAVLPISTTPKIETEATPSSVKIISEPVAPATVISTQILCSSGGLPSSEINIVAFTIFSLHFLIN